MRQIYLPFMLAAVLASGAYAAIPQLASPAGFPAPDRSKSLKAPLTEVPEGESKLYSRAAMTWVNDYGYISGKETTDMASFFVFTDGGDVYLKDPFSGFLYSTWLKGSVKGDEIVFELPQVMYQQYDETGNLQDYSAYRMKFVPGDDGGYYEADAEQTFTFVIKDDGSIVQKVENKEDDVPMLGLCSSDKQWTGYGDFNYVFTPFSTQALTIPANLTPENYAMMYDKGDGHFCKVAFDGEDVYIQGVYPTTAGCIKGKLRDGRVSFPSGQYVGVESSVLRSSFVYLSGVKVETKKNEEYGYEEKVYTGLPSIEMTFDAEKKVFTAADAIGMSTSAREYVNMTLPYTEPVLRYQAPDAVPGKPEKPSFEFVEFNQNAGIGSIYLSIPKTDVNGMLLNTENMYYSLYVDGELFTFEPDEYASLSEAVTEVPYLYNDGWDISGGNFLMHYIYYFFDGADTFGAESIYKDSEGNRYVSDRAVYSFKQESVDALQGGKRVASSVFYDMTGRRVDDSCKGFVIRVDRYEDGSIETFKQLQQKK